MLWTDLFLLWNRISHITRYLLPVNTRKHCISNSLKYHASPHFLYRPIDIITLLYDMPLGVTVSIKKEVSSLFTHYWLPILLILFTSLRLSQALFEWLHSMEDSVDRSSLIGDAILYTLNQENYLRRYLDDGHLSIDNNSAKRAIKNFAVGRRNWLFAKSIRGADASAVVYSIA